MSPLEDKAAQLSRDEIVALLVSEQELTTRVEELKRQLEWFKRQLFGSKSERRLAATVDERQLFLGEQLAQDSGPEAPTDTVRSYVRRRSPDAEDGASEESAVRFDPSVPVEEIQLPNPEIENLPPDRYDIVGEKVTLRLAQLPGSYVLLRYVRRVVKLKETGTFSCPPARAGVLEKSLADVSLLAGILIDKFTMHLPLYRQHQRMVACGIHLDRSTLTQWVHRTAALLEPIYAAQWESVLASSVLVMDETPIKAGRVKRAGHNPGKMKTGFFWPVYGDRDEIVFPFSATRAHAVVRELLGTYAGVLLTDGYEAYDRYAAQVAQVVHAQCWSHYLESSVIWSTVWRTPIPSVSRACEHTTTPHKAVAPRERTKRQVRASICHAQSVSHTGRAGRRREACAGGLAAKQLLPRHPCHVPAMGPSIPRLLSRE